MTEDAFLKNHSLPLMLPGLVEIAILIVSDWTPDRRIEYARGRAQSIAEKSDVLMFGSKKNGEAGQLIAELAKVVACLSFQPGGVKLFGHHWQAEPDRADPTLVTPSLADLFTFTDDPPPAALPLPGDDQP